MKSSIKYPASPRFESKYIGMAGRSGAVAGSGYPVHNKNSERKLTLTKDLKMVPEGETLLHSDAVQAK